MIYRRGWNGLEEIVYDPNLKPLFPIRPTKPVDKYEFPKDKIVVSDTGKRFIRHRRIVEILTDGR